MLLSEGYHPEKWRDLLASAKALCGIMQRNMFIQNHVYTESSIKSGRHWKVCPTSADPDALDLRLSGPHARLALVTPSCTRHALTLDLRSSRPLELVTPSRWTCARHALLRSSRCHARLAIIAPSCARHAVTLDLRSSRPLALVTPSRSTCDRPALLNSSRPPAPLKGPFVHCRGR
jgi:hypothetical protein